MYHTNYAVLIPVYNEERTIKKVIDEVRYYRYPFVVVNDGSTDKTLDIIKELTDDYVTYNVNRGKGYAIKHGAKDLIDEGYNWIIVVDSDSQSNISNIINVLKLRYIHPKARILVGNRLNSPSNMPLIRLLANKIMSFIISLLIGQNVPDTQCWLKIIHKDVFDLDLECNRFDFESEMLVKAGRKGYKIVSGDVDCIYSKNIKSHQNYIKDWWRFIRLILKLMSNA